MHVLAVVVAGGRSGAVDPLVTVGGVPMVTRAVRCLLTSRLVDHVVVLDEPGRSADVLRACSGLPVSVQPDLGHALPASSGHRPAATGAGPPAALPSEVVVLLHDAARPLAPPELAAAVTRAVGSGHSAAVPVLPLSDTVKRVATGGTLHAGPDRAGLRVLQTPHAFRAELLDGPLATHPLVLATEHAAAGGAVRVVPGHPLAFPVRSAWDLELAELLVGGEVL